jgi:hypothetical protein
MIAVEVKSAGLDAEPVQSHAAAGERADDGGDLGG